jgi:3',5'-nucleoside bisphosphate phosphatase
MELIPKHSGRSEGNQISFPPKVQKIEDLSQAELAAQIRDAGLIPFLRSLTPEICRALLGRADLHVHSIFSDGTRPPSWLVENALKRKMSLLLLCDHDTFEGCGELIQVGVDQPIAVGAGIEFSSVYDGIAMHVLGLGFDIKRACADQELVGWLQTMRGSFRDHIRQVLEKLNRILLKEGVPDFHLASWKEVEKIQPLKIPERAEIGWAMIRKLMKLGIAEDQAKKATYEHLKYIRPGGKAEGLLERDRALYLPVQKLVPKIQELGGVLVLAHPMDYQNLTEKHLIQLRELGVEGLEIYSGHQKESPLARNIAEWERLCLALGFFPSFGSDFHGPDRRRNKLADFPLI